MKKINNILIIYLKQDKILKNIVAVMKLMKQFLLSINNSGFNELSFSDFLYTLLFHPLLLPCRYMLLS